MKYDISNTINIKRNKNEDDWIKVTTKLNVDGENQLLVSDSDVLAEIIKAYDIFTKYVTSLIKGSDNIEEYRKKDNIVTTKTTCSAYMTMLYVPNFISPLLPQSVSEKIEEYQRDMYKNKPSDTQKECLVKNSVNVFLEAAESVGKYNRKKEDIIHAIECFNDMYAMNIAYGNILSNKFDDLIYGHILPNINRLYDYLNNEDYD